MRKKEERKLKVGKEKKKNYGKIGKAKSHKKKECKKKIGMGSTKKSKRKTS